MSVARPALLLRRLQRISAIAALLCGFALTACLFAAPRVGLALLTAATFLNAVQAEALRAVLADLRETRP